MLYDRPYMRERSWRGGMLLTTKLMIVLAIIFVLQSILEFWGGVPVIRLFGLSPAGLAHGYVWQLLTFQFLHGGLFHLLMNLVAIFFFGRAIEGELGGRRMIGLYLASGVVGGVCQVLFELVMSLRDPVALQIPVVGASAGGFGLVAAFAVLFPDRTITLLVFFVLPVSFRARTLLWVAVAMGAFGMLIPNDGVAHAAHLGGILCAVLYVNGFVLGTWSLPTIRVAPRRRAAPRVRVFQGGKPSGGDAVSSGEEPDFGEGWMGQVDPILDKIHAHGIQSLTARERSLLEAAHKRMGERKGR